MDRPIDKKLRHREIARKTALTLVGLSALVAIFIWLPGWIKPSINRNRVRTAQVDTGPVESTTAASGLVVPAFEQVLVSPIDSRILQLLHKPGSALAEGDAILVLDLGEADLGVTRIEQLLELNRNQQRQLGIDLQKRLGELSTEFKIQQLEVQNLHTKTLQSVDLLDIGAVSKEYVRQAELAEERARLQLQQIDDTRSHAAESTDSQTHALMLERVSLERELEEAQRRRRLAEIRADRPGVLTWVLAEEGAAVHPGEIVARVADLSSFRVDATISDIHANRIGAGLPVHVGLGNDEFLEGEVTRIAPAVENGVMEMEVSLLADAADPRLRSNMRVEVYVVTEHKTSARRVARGASVGGTSGISATGAHVFAITGDRAIRKSVEIGLCSFDYCEVIAGLDEGEVVIVSDMSDFLHMEEVAVK